MLMKDEKKKPLINVMESLIEANIDESGETWYKLLEESIKELKES